MAADKRYDFDLSDKDPFKNLYAQRADSFRVFLYELGVVGSEANWRINQIFTDWLLTHRLNNYFLRTDSSVREYFAQGSFWSDDIAKLESADVRKIAESMPQLFSILLDVPEVNIKRYLENNRVEFRYLLLFTLSLISGKDTLITKFDSTLQKSLRVKEEESLNFHLLFQKTISALRSLHTQVVAEI